MYVLRKAEVGTGVDGWGSPFRSRQMGGGSGEERVGGGWKAIERWLVWWLKDGWGLIEVSDGLCGVGKRLLDGWGNGCAMFESSGSRADVRPWTLPLRGEHVEEIGSI